MYAPIGPEGIREATPLTIRPGPHDENALTFPHDHQEADPLTCLYAPREAK